MNFLRKLSLTMAKLGCAGLRNASDENKDNLEYVKAVVKNQDVRSFQFASDWIKSDAQSLIEMSKVNFETLRFANYPIMDRWVNGDVLEEKEVDYIIFAFKCMEKDINALIYFKTDIQTKVIEILKTQNVVEGEIGGTKCCIDLKKFKCNDMLVDLVFSIQLFGKKEVLQN